MKTRLLSALLTAAMVLSLTSCSDGTPGGTTEDHPAAPPQKTPVDHTVVLASYPVQAQHPDFTLYTDQEKFHEDWERWREDQRSLDAAAVPAGIIEDFLRATVPEFLTGTQGNEVYSPVNVYMALAMLAEVTDGNSRAQLLDVLGVESLEQLRQDASGIWKTAYRDDGAVTSVLASSLWLDEDVEYVPETMQALAEHYFASSYTGEMGSGELNEALRAWLNEQTGGLLEEQAADLELAPETILALATTVYFRTKWSNEFNPDRTEKGEFTILSPDGGTVPCEFMKSSGTDTYYWSDKFSAVGRGLENGGRMWFILPDGDVSVTELVDDPVTMDFLLADGAWEESKFLRVNLAVPKFDVASETDLTGGMKRLGVTDIFNPACSDFTPTTTQMEGIVLSQAEHAARVAIDEEGVTAAAYTVMAAAGSAMPPEEVVDFILDRPFLFAITANGGLPLFMGVVQDPR